MLQVRLVCVGKLKEKFFAGAAEEYLKRLSAYCKIETDELAEAWLPEHASPADMEGALRTEADAILGRVPKGASLAALCVEGDELDSAGLADLLRKYAGTGVSKLCFVIGGSNGLHESVKNRAELRLSMSRMTFPHHLARIMLLEQLYRAFTIVAGGKYHK